MSEREADLKLLAVLLDKHADQLTDKETEAFAGMRFSLTAYEGNDNSPFHQLTDRQRQWCKDAYARIVPQYANLVSGGHVPKGTPTAESKALDKMLAAPKVLRPPPIPKSTGAPQRASKRHCGKQDDGCYAFVNGDCSCACCARVGAW